MTRLSFIPENIRDVLTAGRRRTNSETLIGWAWSRVLRCGAVTISRTGEPLLAFDSGATPTPITGAWLRAAWFQVDVARSGPAMRDDTFEAAAASLRDRAERRSARHDARGDAAIAVEVHDTRAARRQTRTR